MTKLNNKEGKKQTTDNLFVVERGFFHGNVVVSWDDDALVLVDTGYCSGVDELSQAIEDCLPNAKYSLDRLSRIILTHVHSDHAGGVAALHDRSSCQVLGSQRAKQLVDEWDTKGMWVEGMEHELPRFSIDTQLHPGESFTMAGQVWEVLSTPGHATGGLGFFAPETGVLIAGDALWHDGFGSLNPIDDGEQVFDEAYEALAHIEACAPRAVIPGHGPIFYDVREALQRARSKLAHFRAHKETTYRLGLQGAVGFWMMAHKRVTKARFFAYLAHLHAHYPVFFPGSLEEESAKEALLSQLVHKKLIQIEGDEILEGPGLKMMTYPPRISWVS